MENKKIFFSKSNKEIIVPFNLDDIIIIKKEDLSYVNGDEEVQENYTIDFCFNDEDGTEISLHYDFEGDRDLDYNRLKTLLGE